LFLASSVDHGFRGAGATPTGQMEAIVRWVEQGQAPGKLLAQKRESSGKFTQTRLLFPFQLSAKYKGTGRTEDAANFVAHTPDQ